MIKLIGVQKITSKHNNGGLNSFGVKRIAVGVLYQTGGSAKKKLSMRKGERTVFDSSKIKRE